MNILVTGGAGYIGSVVVERLLASGHNAVIYDNLSAGHRGAVAPGAKLIVGELDDRAALVGCMREHTTEAVIHLAAHAIVSESMTNPSRYFRNNVVAGIALLDAMVERGVKRIVFSSTCAVYGEPEDSPITEDSRRRPANPYGESKLAFERLLHWHDIAHEIKYTSLRYFNAAGATANFGEHHLPETHLIPIVLGCALGSREEVEIFGSDYPTADGTCVRDYIHVIDLADAHIRALGMFEGSSCAYNLGTGKGYSVREVIEAARRITGHAIRVQVSPRRPGDPAVLVAGS
ncbi:MAG TPA: UDP-glucose 4-epimerase GalE, partial [Blastocatellia bacterium]